MLVVTTCSLSTSYAHSSRENNITFHDPDGYGGNQDVLHKSMYLLDYSDKNNYKVSDSQEDLGFTVTNNKNTVTINAGRKQSEEVSNWIINTYQNMNNVEYAGANPWKSTKDKILREKFNFATYDGTLIFFMNDKVYVIKHIGLSQHHSGFNNFWTIYSTGDNCQKDPGNNHALMCKSDASDDYIFIKRYPKANFGAFNDPSNFIVSSTSIHINAFKKDLKQMGHDFVRDARNMFDFKNNTEEALMNTMQIAMIVADPIIGKQMKGMGMPNSINEITPVEIYKGGIRTPEMKAKVIETLRNSYQSHEPKKALEYKMKQLAILDEVYGGELSKEFMKSEKANTLKGLASDKTGELAPQLARLLEKAYPIDLIDVSKNFENILERAAFTNKLDVMELEAYKDFTRELHESIIKTGSRTIINAEGETIGRIYDDQVVISSVQNNVEFETLKADTISELTRTVKELNTGQINNVKPEVVKYKLNAEIRSILDNPMDARFADIKQNLSEFYSEINKFVEETTTYKDYNDGIQKAVKDAYDTKLKASMESIKTDPPINIQNKIKSIDKNNIEAAFNEAIKLGEGNEAVVKTKDGIVYKKFKYESGINHAEKINKEAMAKRSVQGFKDFNGVDAKIVTVGDDVYIISPFIETEGYSKLSDHGLLIRDNIHFDNATEWIRKNKHSSIIDLSNEGNTMIKYGEFGEIVDIKILDFDQAISIDDLKTNKQSSYTYKKLKTADKMQKYGLEITQQELDNIINNK